MQDMLFIAVSAEGKITMQGKIVNQVNQHDFLCRFDAGPATHFRIVESSELKSFLLFSSPAQLESYVHALQSFQQPKQSPEKENEVAPKPKRTRKPSAKKPARGAEEKSKTEDKPEEDFLD